MTVFPRTANESEWLAGGADEIAQNGDVRTVGADAASVDRKTKAFSLIEIDSRVIQLGKAETGGGRDPVHARRVNRAGRATPMPGPASQFIELLPIAFVPSVHSYALFESVHWMRRERQEFARVEP